MKSDVKYCQQFATDASRCQQLLSDDKIIKRRAASVSLLTWKALYTAEPSYLSELISPYVLARILRSSNTYIVSIPTGVTSHFSSRSFSVAEPSTWNSTSTYSLYRQTLNVQALTKVTLLPVCFYCLVTLRQRLWFVSTILDVHSVSTNGMRIMRTLLTYADYTVTLTVTDSVMLISQTKLTLTVTLTLTDTVKIGSAST